MDDAVRRMVRAFEALNPEQKMEFLNSVIRYKEHGTLDESVRKDSQINMGPLGSRCPYCGK